MRGLTEIIKANELVEKDATLKKLKDPIFTFEEIQTLYTLVYNRQDESSDPEERQFFEDLKQKLAVSLGLKRPEQIKRG